MPEYATVMLLVSLIVLLLGLLLKCRNLSDRLKKSESEQDSLASELNTLKDAHRGEISDIKEKHKKETDELRNKIRKLSHMEHPIDRVTVAKNGRDE